MTYSEAIQFLYDLRWFGAKFGLANTFKLAALSGDPQRKLRFIHVAGTNGKGSTCAMLESIYREAGLRIGLFTSPHLVAFGERIQINREPISESEVVKQVAALRPLLKEFAPEEHPTFFEVVTVMALRYFSEQKCDLVIWETGLGGRLDATNIVDPLATIITNVQYDHQIWLGETLDKIAFEKAGIIKHRIPIITAAAEPEAVKVIEETARQQRAELIRVTEADTQRPPLDSLELPLAGKHQRLNAALAIATVRTLSTEIPLTEETMVAGLTRVQWPGRMQSITRPSGQKILLDGAHNVAGVQALAAALRESFGSLRPAFILGILQDKDWGSMCRIVAPLASRILLVPINNERAATPEELQRSCHDANPDIEAVACSTLEEALQQTAAEPLVIVTGSLYLVGEALEHIQLMPTNTFSERSLNEWRPTGEPSTKSFA